jgi:hypothetical protein
VSKVASSAVTMAANSAASKEILLAESLVVSLAVCLEARWAVWKELCSAVR